MGFNKRMNAVVNGLKQQKNYLPKDGMVHYFGCVFEECESTIIFENLIKEISWQHDENFIYGKKIITKRKVGWYGSKPFAYTYSKTTKVALPFTPTLIAIKNKIEQITQATYNSCLLNLYHNGNEGMGWHTDAEKELLPNGSIASVSFGAARFFDLKHKETAEKIRIALESGSLLEMKGSTQLHWKHQMPITKKVLEPRINLTFRTIVG
jgi:alkylated DNA repair dioxygenase AlkB